MNWVARRFEGRMHYGWIAVGVVFFVLLAAAGTRATPSVMMLPLEKQFGWSRGTISLAISINLALYGLAGPFAAAAMQRFGVRPTLLTALATLAAGVGVSSMMTAPWQMILVWGVLVGGATGVAALTLSATVVNRWFTTHRGLAMGLNEFAGYVAVAGSALATGFIAAQSGLRASGRFTSLSFATIHASDRPVNGHARHLTWRPPPPFVVAALPDPGA